MRRSQNPLTASVLQVTLAIVNALRFTSVTRAQQSPASQAPRSPPPEGGQIPRQEENKKTEPAVVNERWNFYGPEYIWETYYSARLFPGFFAAFNLQRVANPAYNQDRGPVWVSSIRFHIEIGKQTFAPSNR